MLQTKQNNKKKSIKPKKNTNKRQINLSTQYEDKTGLNLSVARVKNFIINNIFNKEENTIISNLRELEKTNTPIETLQGDIKDYIDEIKNENQIKKKHDYEVLIISQYEEKKKKKYEKGKKREKIKKGKDFDIYKFNTSVDPDFYSEYKNYLIKSNENVYSYLINLISKRRVRFSKNTHIILTSFIEYLIKELFRYSILSCSNKKKSIIKISHYLESEEKKTFNFEKVIKTFDCYKKSEEWVSNKNKLEELVELNYSKNFRFYLNELCKSVKKKLNERDDLGPDIKQNICKISISKSFKIFSSNILIEILTRIGKMMLIEIKERNIKTLNTNITYSAIRQFMAAHNVNEKEVIININSKVLEYEKKVVIRAKKKSIKREINNNNLKNSEEYNNFTYENTETDENIKVIAENNDIAEIN